MYYNSWKVYFFLVFLKMNIEVLLITSSEMENTEHWNHDLCGMQHTFFSKPKYNREQFIIFFRLRHVQCSVVFVDLSFKRLLHPYFAVFSQNLCVGHASSICLAVHQLRFLYLLHILAEVRTICKQKSHACTDLPIPQKGCVFPP